MEITMKTQIHARVPILPLALMLPINRSLTYKTVLLSVLLINPECPGLSPLKSISKKGNSIPRETKEKMIERIMNKI